ncbi:uncharacterized protein LOC135388182 [Ornithodoros turicata]|uniref:uncharacterized protein LOC135388182 n=1 Tax=Ornithodoros turicata TaxID=34597 RepID=UPI003138AB22
MELLRVGSLLFVFALHAARCESGCEPEIPGRCFQDFLLSIDGVLQAHTKAPPGGIHGQVKALCRSVHEATQCEDDVLDDCSVEGATFEHWKEAFETIHNAACNKDSSLFRSVIKEHECWDMSTFLSCASNVTGIWNMEDLAPLETHQCMTVEDSLHGCVDKAYNKCSRKVDSCALRRLVSVFYSTALCPNFMEVLRGSAPLASLSVVVSVLCVFFRVL